MEGAFYIPDIFSDASESDWSNFEQLLEDYDFVDLGHHMTPIFMLKMIANKIEICLITIG